MTSKQLVTQLYNNMVSNLDFTDEQVQLIIKLQQSFETDEQRTERIAHFKSVVNTAVANTK